MSKNIKNIDTHVFGRMIPDFLYKYRRLDIRSLSALAENKLYFVNYTLFNDPFDCQAGYSLDKIIAYSKFYGVENELTGLNSMRVCSFSEKRDDILMWGHYADSFNGFCIEFNLAADFDLRSTCWPVEYRDTYPDLLTPHPHLPLTGNFAFIKLMLSKSIQWAYEKELRAFLHVPTDKASKKQFILKKYNPIAISSVIFGMKMPEEYKKLIKNVLIDQKHIKYYTAIKNNSQYSLYFV